MHDHEIAMCAYAQLAAISAEKQQAAARDRFLLLTGIEACQAGWLDVANRCHAMILATNPAHQLHRHATMADAMRDSEFRQLAAKWERYCPFEQAEHLLLQLGRSPEGEEPEMPRGTWVMQRLNAVT